MNIKNIYPMGALCLLLYSISVEAAVPPPQQSPTSPPSQTGPAKKDFTIDFYNVPIQDVLRAIALQKNLNIVTDPEVQGNVTLHLENLNFREGLQYLLNSVHATYEEKNGVFHVLKKKKEKETIKTQKQGYLLSIKNGRINLSAKKVDIKILLQDIAEQSGLNLSFNQNIRGNISSHLIDIPLKRGLMSILKDTNYALKEDKGLYMIQKITRKVRFQITYDNQGIMIKANNAALKEVLHDLALKTGISIVSSTYVKGKVNAVIHSDQIETAIDLLLVGSGFQYKKIGTVFVIGNGNDLKAHSLFFMDSKLIRLKFIRAKEVIKKLPPSFPVANLQFFEGQNALSITGSSAFVNAVEQFIQKLDKPIPQIKVEVLIVEYNLNSNRNMGLSLTNVNATGFGSKHTSVNINPSQLSPITFTYDVAKTLSKSFKINLQALIDTKRAKVTANPSIWALNGHEATIDVVTQDRFREHRFNEANGRLEPVGVPRTIESGVKLKIRPWITGEDEIILEIEPEVSHTTGTTSIDNLPQTSKRKAKTVLKVKNGRTVVIGGLIQVSYENTVKKTPFLGNVPFLGTLFTTKAKKEQRTELVFYITPTISNSREIDKKYDKEEFLKVASPQFPLQKDSLSPQITVSSNNTRTSQQTHSPQDVLPPHRHKQIHWPFQEDSIGIGEVRRRRQTANEWQTYSQKLERRAYVGSLSQRVAREGWPQILADYDAGYDITLSSSDKTYRNREWNSLVDQILKEDQNWE
jgi:type IV pilus assembly protein PilQ